MVDMVVCIVKIKIETRTICNINYLIQCPFGNLATSAGGAENKSISVSLSLSDTQLHTRTQQTKLKKNNHFP